MVGKGKCLCPGEQGRSSLWICCWTSLWGLVWCSQQSREGTAQWLHSDREGATYTPREPRKQAEMSNRNIGGKVCNRRWLKLKAMEYFTSAPFSHLLRLYSPMAAQKYRKEAALALGYPPIQGCGKLENSVSWSDAATARLPSERQPLSLSLSNLSQSQLDVNQCLFFSWHLSPKPPVFKETDEQKRSQTHSSSKVSTSAWQGNTNVQERSLSFPSTPGEQLQICFFRPCWKLWHYQRQARASRPPSWPSKRGICCLFPCWAQRLNHLFYLHHSPGLTFSCLYNPGLPVKSQVAHSNLPHLFAEPATTTVKEAAWLLWNFYKTKYVHRDRLLNYSHFTFNHHV